MMSFILFVIHLNHMTLFQSSLHSVLIGADLVGWRERHLRGADSHTLSQPEAGRTRQGGHGRHWPPNESSTSASVCLLFPRSLRLPSCQAALPCVHNSIWGFLANSLQSCGFLCPVMTVKFEAYLGKGGWNLGNILCLYFKRDSQGWWEMAAGFSSLNPAPAAY